MDIEMDIRHFRKSIGLSQKQFGELFGVTQGAISQWEHGITRPCGPQAATIISKSKGRVTLEEIYPRTSLNKIISAGIMEQALNE